MLEIEDILCELKREEEDGLPPGFRFHPTDEELITFYLASKVFPSSSSSSTTVGLHIAEVDLNRCEPWELPDVAKMGEREWYLFSMRDRKYPTGLRTNRATGAGYWKATGKDREVYSGATGCLLGMKKTLVFYRGRAPRGEKTKWVMHEYRLDGHLSARQTPKEEWVICRIYHRAAGLKKDARMGQSYPTLKTLMASSANVTFLHTHSHHHQKETMSSFAFHHYLPQPQENDHAAINGVLGSSFPTTSDKTDFYLACSNNNTIPCIFKSLISPNENDKNNTSIFYGMSSSSAASQMVGAPLQESWPPMDHLLQVDIPPHI